MPFQRDFSNRDHPPHHRERKTATHAIIPKMSQTAERNQQCRKGNEPTTREPMMTGPKKPNKPQTVFSIVVRQPSHRIFLVDQKNSRRSRGLGRDIADST